MFPILDEFFKTSSNRFLPITIIDSIIFHESFNKSIKSFSIKLLIGSFNFFNSKPREKQIDLSNSSATSIGTEVLSPMVYLSAHFPSKL